MEQTLWVSKENGWSRLLLLDVKVIDGEIMIFGDDEYDNELKVIPITEFNEKYERLIREQPALRIRYAEPVRSNVVDMGNFIDSMIWH